MIEKVGGTHMFYSLSPTFLCNQAGEICSFSANSLYTNSLASKSSKPSRPLKKNLQLYIVN
jgi:hypothetical protein